MAGDQLRDCTLCVQRHGKGIALCSYDRSARTVPGRQLWNDFQWSRNYHKVYRVDFLRSQPDGNWIE